VIDHFDLLAPLYDRVIGAPDPARLRELLHLPTAGRLQDAGGGTGRLASQLRRDVGGLVVADVSRPMLRQAGSKGELAGVQAYVEHLPFPDGAFDRVLVVDTLHHFPDAAGAVRVLAPGGRLVIEERDIAHASVKLIALAERLALMGSHFFSPAAIRDMVERAGVPAWVEADGRFAAWVVAEMPGPE
jgi:demethylmenaquinone methyltransferase/2-methoxy-6-polyprenyl-1,4-benzoquinol methylase